jgi:hypothetical protein
MWMKQALLPTVATMVKLSRWLNQLVAPNSPAHLGTANFVRAIFALALDFFD